MTCFLSKEFRRDERSIYFSSCRCLRSCSDDLPSFLEVLSFNDKITFGSTWSLRLESDHEASIFLLLQRSFSGSDSEIRRAIRGESSTEICETHVRIPQTKLIHRGWAVHASSHFNCSFNFANLNISKCLFHVKILVTFNSEAGKVSPVFVFIDLVELIGHELLLFATFPDFLLVVPVLKLLSTRSFDTLGSQRIGISSVGTPCVLRTHSLTFGHLAHVKLLELRVSISGDTHLTITSIKLIELNIAVP
mmetsp:Transcript_68439/g.198464  ORF Transcript_68439/g.198464 Transcript_68439/m.198464 type:complete len:249 (+) Transcript_68439:60-806(+)